LDLEVIRVILVLLEFKVLLEMVILELKAPLDQQEELKEILVLPGLKVLLEL
jgi:hypothetical protein